jgi:[ribosomal protein S5]-alanine N-acetyltransferase
VITKDFTYPSLETERLILRILTLEDVKEVYLHFSDENITKYMDIEPCKDETEAREIIQFHLDDIGCRWGIFLKESGQFIGTGGFHYLRNQNNQLIGEVGFDLAKSHWGKGLMQEVMKAIIRFGFEEMKLDVIDATVEPENERSLALMHRLGFTRAAELQGNLAYFYINKL